MLDWKFKGEDVLRQSQLDYAIIRPGGLIDKPGGKDALMIDQGDHIIGTISRENLTTVILHVLFFPTKLGITFEVIDSDQNKKIDWTEQFATLTPDRPIAN